ncbi:MAG: DKNYY domain-containing protein [Oceanicaulis sp.]
MRALLLVLLPVLLCAACGPTGYVQRKDRVYWASYPGSSAFPTLERVEREIEADPATFRVEPFRDWASDHALAYYEGRTIGAVDQASFAARSKALAADRDTVWLYGEPVPGADPASFRRLAPPYAIDARNAYSGRLRIEVCDLPSFRVVGEGIDSFGIDDQCVFAGTFRVPVEDSASFELLGAGYAGDVIAVYWRQHRIEGADQDTFHVPAGMRYGVDKSGCWNGTRPQPCLN